MSPGTVPTLFKCVKCGKEYNKRSSFRSHMETHSDKFHECDQCEKKYKQRGHLLEHKRTAHVEAGRFECDECGKLFPHKKALRGHKRSHSNEFKCPVCNKGMLLRNSSRHMDAHEGQRCECDLCGTTHRNPRALTQHERRAHSEAKHSCEHCGKIFGLARDLRRHMTVHDEKREECRCARCARTFKSLQGREKHTRMEHSDSRFTCDPECGLQSATRAEYRDHLNSRHAKQHPTTCKCVLVNVKRAQHVATNLGNNTLVAADGTIKCTSGDCDFVTTCARRMESHKNQCHYDAYQPVLHCISCETWFSEPSHLKSHNAEKHQGERRFRCDKCGYVTNARVTFTNHQTSCEQGKARGNRKLNRSEPTIDNLDVKKESPHVVYRFESELGEGGFGTVYKAVKKGEDSSVKYAIKENVMALLEYYEFEQKGRLTRFLVMECCRPGSLTTMQKLVQFRFEEPHVLYVLKEVTCGLEHLHSAGVIHRDLKSANVLVNERAEVKIADFGVSTDERVAYNFRGTRGWVAPEVAATALTGTTGLKSAYTQKADVYSVGVLAIDCFLPRETLPTDFFHKKKVESESFAEAQLQRIENDRHLQLSDAFKKLVSRCLEPMTTRLSAAAVQKVPAVKKASVEPFKDLVAECLKQKAAGGGEAKRTSSEINDRRIEPSNLRSSPTHRSGLSTTSAAEQQPSTSSGMSSLFSASTQRSQQASTSTGTSNLFSAAAARTHNGHSTAYTTAVSSLFRASEAHSQQASTSGGMSSLFFSTASSLDH